MVVQVEDNTRRPVLQSRTILDVWAQPEYGAVVPQRRCVWQCRLVSPRFGKASRSICWQQLEGLRPKLLCDFRSAARIAYPEQHIGFRQVDQFARILLPMQGRKKLLHERRSLEKTLDVCSTAYRETPRGQPYGRDSTTLMNERIETSANGGSRAKYEPTSQIRDPRTRKGVVASAMSSDWASETRLDSKALDLDDCTQGGGSRQGRYPVREKSRMHVAVLSSACRPPVVAQLRATRPERAMESRRSLARVYIVLCP